MTQQRPIILEIEEAKNKLMQRVNAIMQAHNLPCYFMEPIIKDIYTQVKIGAQDELESAKAQLSKKQGAE